MRLDDSVGRVDQVGAEALNRLLLAPRRLVQIQVGRSVWHNALEREHIRSQPQLLCERSQKVFEREGCLTD